MYADPRELPVLTHSFPTPRPSEQPHPPLGPPRQRTPQGSSRTRATSARCRACPVRGTDRRCRAPTDLPVLWRHHDRHRGVRAPLSASRAATAIPRTRDTYAVIRHGLAPTRSSAPPPLQATPLPPVPPKRRSRQTKIRPPRFQIPLLNPKA